MKLNTLEKLYACLRDEKPEIIIEPSLIKQAEKSIKKMLEISAQLGL
jgi:quinolinate synthase